MGKKIVVDTNILISALGWDGPQRKLYRLCLRGNFELCLSRSILHELVRVMGYSKFKFTKEETASFLNSILEIATILNPRKKLRIIKEDPPNNRVLECAVEVGANAIISGDNHLLQLKEFKGIKILSAAEFLECEGNGE